MLFAERRDFNFTSKLFHESFGNCEAEFVDFGSEVHLAVILVVEFEQLLQLEPILHWMGNPHEDAAFPRVSAVLYTK